MRNVARALLNAVAFLELSNEDAVELEASVKALEQISSDLQSATPEELEILASVSAELAKESRSAGPAFSDAATFFESFAENFGVGLSGEAGSE